MRPLRFRVPHGGISRGGDAGKYFLPNFETFFKKKIFQIVYFDEDGKVSECAWEEEDPRGIKKGPIKKSLFLGKGGGEGGGAI